MGVTNTIIESAVKLIMRGLMLNMDLGDHLHMLKIPALQMLQNIPPHIMNQIEKLQTSGAMFSK